VIGFAATGYLPRQIKQIGYACNGDSFMEQRVALKNAAQPQAYSNKHRRESQHDAKYQRQTAPDSIVNARAHQHDVIGPGSDRGGQGKQKYGDCKLDADGGDSLF
jgi:hypothetical protein